MAEKIKEVGVTISDEKQVNQFIQSAIEKGLPVETMEKLFALHKEVKAEQAKSAFIAALGNFQNEVPIITKTKKVLNNNGSVRYQYAPLETIIEQIKIPLSANGLSYSWTVENKEGFIKATAKATHAFGHSEESSFEIPVDKGGFMTAPQQYASALTFAKRYALINVLGISTSEEDLDATDVNKEKDVKSIKAKIIFRLKTLEKKTETKEDILKAVAELTQLSLNDKNLSEIASRLQVLIDEKNGDYDYRIKKKLPDQTN